MTIYDYATPFIKAYVPTEAYYEKCFNQNKEVYDYYFAGHCRDKELKMKKALVEHPNKLEQMQWVAANIKPLVKEITSKYEQVFPVKFTQDVYIFVGLGGSNAYTYRSMDPQIAFCVERLDADEGALQVIIAHEYGHALHHKFTTYSGIEASAIDWYSPYTWLLQEGMATYLSMQVVDVPRDIYFAYTRDVEWLTFCEENQSQIIAAFLHDLAKSSTTELFKEWFSINGGMTFGYTRLAYYIGTALVESFVEEFGIEQTMTLWGRQDFKELIEQRLEVLLNS